MEDLLKNPELTSEPKVINLRGVLLPFTTPFTADEVIAIASLRTNLQRWNGCGITGYVALGSTGERVNLDEREYLTVLETARDVVPPHLTFIAGAGQQSTRHTVNEVKRAAAAGADAVLVLTPSFYRAAITQEALVSHYKNVADAATVPVILYSMPDLTGVVIEPGTVALLSEHPNIIGVKDSSADIPRFTETLNLVASDFCVMTGHGTVLYPALRAGASGAILAVGCVAAECCLEIYRCVVNGDPETAATLQQKLTPLALAVTKRYGIGGLKFALDLAGFRGGAVRAPLKSPDPIARTEIEQLLLAVRKDSGSNSDDAAKIDFEGFAGAVTT